MKNKAEIRGSLEQVIEDWVSHWCESDEPVWCEIADWISPALCECMADAAWAVLVANGEASRYSAQEESLSGEN